MAGIGFELKKLFRRKGIFAGAYAYGYASVVCCGPMLLGILLLLGVGTIAKASGAALHERQLLNGMITVTLLAGLTVSSFLSLLVTRYLADMLFENKNGRIMPAFWGSTGLLLIFGGLGYGIFLCFAGLTFLEALLCFLLFGEIVTVWTEISFLTAVKDYKCILLAFAAALAVGLLLGVLLVLVLGQPVLSSLMAAMIVSYGIMTVWYLWVLLGYFPENEGSSFAFLAWADRYPTLAWNGLFTNAGLFAHLVLMWIGPYGQKIQGLFFFEPDYDLAAVFAFLSILITTVNFVVSVEVNFYPRYRDYYALFNDRGTIRDIDVACEDMCSVLSRELLYASVRQAFCTFLFLVFGSVLFKRYPLGFTDESLGIFGCCASDMGFMPSPICSCWRCCIFRITLVLLPPRLFFAPQRLVLPSPPFGSLPLCGALAFALGRFAFWWWRGFGWSISPIRWNTICSAFSLWWNGRKKAFLPD